MGRPSKLTDEIEFQFAQAIRAGNYMTTAAALVGLDHATIFRWLKDKRPRYRAFRETVRLARAQCVALVQASVVKAALKDPRAGMQFLEETGRHWRDHSSDEFEAALGDEPCEPKAPPEPEPGTLVLPQEWLDYLMYAYFAKIPPPKIPRNTRLDGLRRSGSDDFDDIDDSDDAIDDGAMTDDRTGDSPARSPGPEPMSFRDIQMRKHAEEVANYGKPTKLIHRVPHRLPSDKEP